jgi:serine/threonine protein kinase
MPLSPGDRIDDYEVLSELGRGGMAQLYLGRQGGLGGFARKVAIKIMHPNIAADPEMQKMFLDEARLSACIQHPNVVKVERIGMHGGAPFIVMEHIEGAPLSAVLRSFAARREHVPAMLAVAIAARVAEALHAAHESTDELGQPLGVVHRDVSPSNVLIDRRGFVKLIDFGIAKARQRLSSTVPGAVKGKLAYMAPEQLVGKGFDRRADVFALGIVLWEMLTMRRLFFTRDDVDTILRIRSKDPIEAPSTSRPELPTRLDDVVLTLLARDVEERFSTAAAARAALLIACPEALHVEPAALAALLPEHGADPSSTDPGRLARQGT